MRNINLLCGDSIKLMKLIPDNSIDLILTDPPYNIAKDNNFKTMGRTGIDFGEWDKGFDQTSWMIEAERILKKDGSLLVFNQWKNLGEIAFFGESIGLIPKDCFR